MYKNTFFKALTFCFQCEFSIKIVFQFCFRSSITSMDANLFQLLYMAIVLLAPALALESGNFFIVSYSSFLVSFEIPFYVSIDYLLYIY